jgi:hypothetical protein
MILIDMSSSNSKCATWPIWSAQACWRFPLAQLAALLSDLRLSPFFQGGRRFFGGRGSGRNETPSESPPYALRKGEKRFLFLWAQFAAVMKPAKQPSATKAAASCRSPKCQAVVVRVLTRLNPNMRMPSGYEGP